MLETIQRTDNQRNHGRSISSGCFKTPDELLDLPDLDVLLGLVRRWVGHDVVKGPSTAGSRKAKIQDYVRHKISYVFAIGCRDFQSCFGRGLWRRRPPGANYVGRTQASMKDG